MPRNRAVFAAVLALVAGIALGVGGSTLLLDDRSSESPSFAATGQLNALPEGPVTVIAETVRLGRGFESRHEHGGPTFNFVQDGRARITEGDGSARVIGPGGFFFEPPGRPHSIEVLADIRLDVIQLVPPGVEATTELGDR